MLALATALAAMIIALLMEAWDQPAPPEPSRGWSIVMYDHEHVEAHTPGAVHESTKRRWRRPRGALDDEC